tara:strand:- start:814 stop:1932 length:1119 start_codon:yes stop_codon:yes gene_type:complete
LKKGFSLPVWVAAAAKSAVRNLLGLPFEGYEKIKIPKKDLNLNVKVHSVAYIKKKSESLAITFVDSGLDLDLTQNLEIWALTSWDDNGEKAYIDKQLNITAGYGVGINEKTSKICISSFAKLILEENLSQFIPKNKRLNVEIVIPAGVFLAERTSNKSFGVVEGLSIIGTTAETYLSASPEQLSEAKLKLDKIVNNSNKKIITFVIGENGLDLAKQFISTPIVKVGNWIGPLIVHAAVRNVKQILLFGYHGKLIKLAGGIFHTHNHLADARIEILVYLSIKEKLPIDLIMNFVNCQSLDEALHVVEDFDPLIANKLWNKIANQIESRSSQYLKKYVINELIIGAVLFDRERKIRWIGNNGSLMFPKTCSIET